MAQRTFASILQDVKTVFEHALYMSAIWKKITAITENPLTESSIDTLREIYPELYAEFADIEKIASDFVTILEDDTSELYCVVITNGLFMFNETEAKNLDMLRVVSGTLEKWDRAQNVINFNSRYLREYGKPFQLVCKGCTIPSEAHTCRRPQKTAPIPNQDQENSGD